MIENYKEYHEVAECMQKYLNYKGWTMSIGFYDIENDDIIFKIAPYTWYNTKRQLLAALEKEFGLMPIEPITKFYVGTFKYKIKINKFEALYALAKIKRGNIV